MKTTIMIDENQWDFMKEKGYRATNLLRAKINELMERESGEKAELQATIKQLNELKRKYIAFLNSKGLTMEFMDFEEKTH